MKLSRPLPFVVHPEEFASQCFAIILFCLLPLADTHAEWLMVEPNSSVPDSFVVYVDSDSIANKRDRMTVRVLLNMRHRSDNGVASVIAVDEYDCKAERMRTHSMSSFSEIDGKGALVREFKTVGDWVKIGNGKINEAVLDSVCPEYAPK
jgi:hypothetical protein